MKDCNYKPSGELQGDSKSIPNKGTGTGFHGADPQLDGAGTGQDDTNSMGSIKSSTKSDSESTPFGGDTRI